jgi:hypothetical protein
LSLCLLLVGGLVLLAQFYGIAGPTAAEGQAKAGPLVAALEQYRQDTGHYPAEPAQLTPRYLAELPQPAPRWAYDYTTQDSGAAFTLTFSLGRNFDGDYCEYTSHSQVWRCSDLI